jgi:translation initiation factor eIF-2B subunit delta
MGNAIRHLKDAIVKVDPQMEESEAKEHLIQVINNFINERITAADTLISKAVAEKIEPDDVILTYAKSSIVYRALLDAHAAGKSFRVIVVDSKPLHEGKIHAKDLAAAGIKVELFAMTGAWHAVKGAKKAILGAHSMMGNGSLYSRVGTGNVTLHAHKNGIPVIVCCESYKFTEKVYLDAITNNEMAPVEELFEEGPYRDTLIEMFKNTPSLQMLNVMYDLTPAEQVDMVVTEYGSLPPSSVPAVLRLLENARTNA